MSSGINAKEDSPNEEEAEVGLSCTLDMFKEVTEVQQMIIDIPVTASKFISAEKGFESLKTILDQYQEQPHLLDPHLQKLLNQLIPIITSPDVEKDTMCLAFQYLWLIVKVRGYKTIIKKMPHEVKDLLPVLKLLEKEEVENDFYGSYILLMWLSIIIYLPFNLMGFDASIECASSTDNKSTVVERIYSIIKKHLSCAQSSREMAAYLASRFVTRPDLREKYLPAFINYSFEILEEDEPANPHLLFHKMGVLRALGLIFKHGKREEMLDYASDAISRLLASNIPAVSDTPLRKYSSKLVQRIGLTFLRPKLASWRYHRGNRSLTSNLKGSLVTALPTAVEGEDVDEEDVPSEIEDVVDYLLRGLKDQDTVVRWSSAKGIGRVSERLPQALADDVLGEILELFSTRESDKAWHGGCLALAELARRGLLLPSRLPEVLPILDKALIYDELRGQCSVGANIRDAACYVCWAFARAFHPDQMAPFVGRIASGLLVVCLFDREIPCRRAASAAFQEHVGRQGNFPHGIDILTTVDYFAVGNRVQSYLTLSLQVAKHSEYTVALIDHLAQKKVNHWDSAIRHLTSKALHNLTFLAPDYVAKNVLPALLSESVGNVLIARHGAILAAGHIIHALFLKAESDGKKLSDFVGNEIVEKIFALVSALDERKLYKGMGGEYMREATAVLVEKCCLAQIPLEGHSELVDKWHNLLEDCVLNFDENIRLCALSALHALWVHCYQIFSEGEMPWNEEVVDRYIKGLKCGRESQCLGYASALGHMPKHLLVGRLSSVLEVLIETTQITPATSSWALTRKEAVQSILKLTQTVGVVPDGNENECMTKTNIEKVFLTLLQLLEDYTMDRRGDIGAWVREAAMQGLQSLTKEVILKDKSMLTSSIVSEMMTRLCQQSVERIDRTRKVAGMTFESLVHSDPEVPNIPHGHEIRHLFPLEWCRDCNWASESSTFSKFVELLDLDVYRLRVLLGLTYALGGVSANLSRYTSDALMSYLNKRIDQEVLLLSFIQAFLQLFRENERNDRVTLPLIKSLSDILSSVNALDHVLEEEDLLPQLLTCLKKECIKCSDYHKLSAIVTTLCEMLRIQSSCTSSILTQLTIFLGYQYPKVRALTATSLLTSLLDYSDSDIVPGEKWEEIVSILEETPWMNSMEEARIERNKVCALIGIPAPQPKKKP